MIPVIRGFQGRFKREDDFCREKGAEHAVDHIWHSRNIVAFGIGQRLHDGWSHSPSPGHRHRGGAGPSDSGAKTPLAFLTLAREGKLLRKEVISRSNKILSNHDVFCCNVIQPTISPPFTKKE